MDLKPSNLADELRASQRRLRLRFPQRSNGNFFLHQLAENNGRDAERVKPLSR